MQQIKHSGGLLFYKYRLIAICSWLAMTHKNYPYFWALQWC